MTERKGQGKAAVGRKAVSSERGVANLPPPSPPKGPLATDSKPRGSVPAGLTEDERAELEELAGWWRADMVRGIVAGLGVGDDAT